MPILTGLLTVVLVLDCLFLILLVLVQLPKKEAGAGLAFGGGTSDAIFGAGSGNALTKMTKYAAGFFIGLTLIISILTGIGRNKPSAIDEKLLEGAKGAAPVAAPAMTPPSAAPAAVSTTLAPPAAPAKLENVDATAAPAATPAATPAPTEPAPAAPAPDSTTATPK